LPRHALDPRLGTAGAGPRRAHGSTSSMTAGRTEREPRAGSKVEIVRSALAVVGLARRASRLRGADLAPAPPGGGAPLHLDYAALRKRGGADPRRPRL
jgi:hypothetical protein